MTEDIDGSERMATAFRDHWAMVRAHALRLVGDGVEADDLAQEAFVRLWMAGRSGAWPAVPAAWLSVVVSNLVVSRARHAAVVRRRGDELARQHVVRTAALGTPIEASERRTLQSAISTVLRDLPGDHRRAIVLAGSGYSAAEIAEELGRSPEAARTLLCRARRRVRSALIATGAIG